MAVIIRLQNLPWSANAVDIRRFFAGRSIPEGGVHIVGGEDGDAFIAFSSDEDARLAMRLDSQQINGIRVRLYLSSKTEMQSVITAAREVAASKPQTKSSAQSEQSTSRNSAVVSGNEALQLVSQSIHLNRDYLSKTQLATSSSSLNYEGTEQWPNYLSQDQYQRSITNQPDFSYDTSQYQESQRLKQPLRSFSPRKGHLESPLSQHSSHIIDEISSPPQLDRQSDKSFQQHSLSRPSEYDQTRSYRPRPDTDGGRFRQDDVDQNYRGHFDTNEFRHSIREPHSTKPANVTHSYNSGDDPYSFEGRDNFGSRGMSFNDDKPSYRSSSDVPLSRSREGFHDRIPSQQSYMDDTAQSRVKGEPYEDRNLPVPSQRIRDGNTEYNIETRRLDEQLDMRNSRNSDRSMIQDGPMPTRGFERDGRSQDPFRYPEASSVHSYPNESRQSSHASYRDDFRRTEEKNPPRNRSHLPQGYEDEYLEMSRGRHFDRNREQRSDYPPDQYPMDDRSRYSGFNRNQSTPQVSRNQYLEANRNENQSVNREPFFDKRPAPEADNFQQDRKQGHQVDRDPSPIQSTRQGPLQNLSRGPTQNLPPQVLYPGPPDNRQDSGYNQNRFPPQNRDQRPPRDQFQHTSPNRDKHPPHEQFQHPPPNLDQRPPPNLDQRPPPNLDQRPPPNLDQRPPPNLDQRPPQDPYQTSPQNRDQRPPQDPYQHPPPSRDQRPPQDRYQHPPPSRDQRPPQDRHQHPPPSRDQRPPQDQFQHPPPNYDQRPRDQYQHPPQNRDRPPPEDQFHRSTQHHDQRPPKDQYQYPPPNYDQRPSQDSYQHPPQIRDQMPRQDQYRGPRHQNFEGNRDRDRGPDSHQSKTYDDNQDINPDFRGDRPDRNRDMVGNRNSSQQEIDRNKFHERDPCIPRPNQVMSTDRKFSGGQDAHLENYQSRGRTGDDMTEQGDFVQQRYEFNDRNRAPPEDRFPSQRQFKEDGSERSIAGSRPERNQQYQGESSNSILGRRYGPMERDTPGFRQEIDFSKLPPWLRKDSGAFPGPHTNMPDQRPPMRHEMQRQRFEGNQPFRPGMFDQGSRPGFPRPDGDDGSFNRRSNQHSGGLLQTPPSQNQAMSKAGPRKSLLTPPTDHDMRRPRPPQTTAKDGDSYEGPENKRMCFDNNSKLQRKRDEDSLFSKQSPTKETICNPSLFVRLSNSELFWTPRQMFSLLRNVRIGKPNGFRFEVDRIGRRTGNVFVKLAAIDAFDSVMVYNGTSVHGGRLKLVIEPCAIEEFYSVEESSDTRPQHVKELPEPLFHRDMCIEITGLPTFYNKEDLIKLFPDSHLDVNDVRIECAKGTSNCNGRGYITCKRKESFDSILSKNGELVYQDPLRITAISKCQLSFFWHKYSSGGSEDHDSRHYSGKADHDGRKERSYDRGERGDFDRSGGRDRNDDRDRDRRDHRDRDRRDDREIDRRDRDRDRSSNRHADDREHDSHKKDRKSHSSESSSKRNETDESGNSRRISNQKSPSSRNAEQQSNNTNSASHTHQVTSPQKNTDTQEPKERNITTYGCELRNIPRNVSVSDIAQFLGRDRSDTSNIHFISNQSSAVVSTTDEQTSKRLCAKDGQKLKLSVIRTKSLNAAELKSKLSNYKTAEGVSERTKTTTITSSDTSTTKGSSSGDKIYTEASPVRLTIGNLPVNATVSKLEEFFHDVKFIPGSVVLRVSAQGKPLGEAMIDLPSSVEVDRIMREFQGKKMGGRPISLRR